MALDFDGSTQYVDTGQNSDLTSWTIMAWVYAHDAISGGQQKIFDRGTNYQINWDHPDSSVRGAAAVKVGSTWYPQKFGTLNNNTIYHLAASFGNNSLKTYQDGSYKGANTSMSGNPLSQVGNARIAGELGVTGWFFDGLIWDVRVYNRVLSANEIAEIYHKRGADRVWQGLVGWWRLDEFPSGTPASLLLDAMDATTGWTNHLQGLTSLNSTTYKEGSGALNVYKTATDGLYPLAYKNLSTSYNLTSKDVWVWVYIKDTTTLNKLAEIRYYLYSTPSYYYHYSFTSLSVGWNMIGKNAASYDGTFGTPDISAINKIQVGAKTNNNFDTLAEGDLIFDFMRAGGNGSDDSIFQVPDLSGNGNHGTLHGGIFQASPHRLRRGVLVS